MQAPKTDEAIPAQLDSGQEMRGRGEIDGRIYM